MRNDIFRLCNPVINACISYNMPPGLCGKNFFAEVCEKERNSHKYARSFGNTRDTRVYNPTVKGYGGYVPRESREWRTLSTRRRGSQDMKAAKRIVGELVSPLASEKKAKSATVREAKRNPILKKNPKLMGRIQRGLRQEDVKYLRRLAKNM